MKLTDEEIRDCIDAADQAYCERDGDKELFIARAIEAAVLERLTKVDVEPVCWHEPGSPHNEPVYNNVTGHKKWALINGWQPLYPASALAALRAENERLKAQKEHYIEQWSEVCNENQRLLNELEKDKKDAARYRFMRDADRSDENCPYEQMLMYAMESLDEAIDAAMENKP